MKDVRWLQINHLIILSFVFVFAFLNTSSSFAGPNRTTYQAKIVKPDGYPLEASSVNFKFTLLDPAGSCILYSETYSSVNMTGTGGLISFALGSGVKTYPVSATTFEQVFSNITPSLVCDAGGPANYSPGASDARKIVMQFHDGTGWQTLPAMAINAVPYAMYANSAQNLNGKVDTDFVQVAALSTCGAGEALNYNGVGFSCVTIPTPQTVSAAAVVSALGYTPADGASVTALSSSLSSTNAEVSSVSSTVSSVSSTVASVSSTVFSVSSTVSSLSNTVSNLSTSVSNLSASMAAITSSQWVTSGTSISYSSGSVGIGTTTPAARLDVSGGVRISMEAVSCAAGLAGTLRYNSGTVEYCNGASWLPFGVAGAGITNINGSTSGSQTFATGVTGTVFNISTVNGVHTFNIPFAASGSVTAGLLSNADYLTFTNKLNATSASVVSVLGYTPANSATALTTTSIFAGDVSGTYNSLVLVDSGVASGSYTKVTVDGKGRVTSGSQLSSSDVTTALGYTPANNAASGTYAQKANNLSDLASATVARTNLGLGSLATLNFLDLSTSQASGTLAAARLPAFSGDATSPLGSSVLTLASVGSGVTSGTQYTKVTVDGKGRVTSGAQLSVTDVTTALGYTPASASASTQWTTSGSAIFYNTGNVGIGTTSPNVQLQVNSSSTMSTIQLTTSSTGSTATDGTRLQLSGTGFEFRNFETSPITFFTANTARMQLDSSGNLAAAWTAGGFRLSNVNPNTAASPAYSFSDETDSGLFSPALGNLAFSTDAVERMRIDSSGNVGIGTVSPTQKLSVAGNINLVNPGASIDRYIAVATNGGGEKAYIRFDQTAAPGPANFWDIGSLSGNNAYDFGFEASGTRRMTLTFAGNLGIGTSAPITRLDISGGLKISMEAATCAASYAGTLRYNGGNVEYCNGSAWTAFGAATVGVNSLNGSASQTQTFANGSTGNAPTFVTANGVHTLNIPLASATGSVTAGLISNADYVNFSNKITSSAASIAQVLGYTPASATALANYAVRSNNLSDLTSSAAARTNLGLGTFATASTIDLGSASATGTMSAARMPALSGDVTTVSGSVVTTVVGLQGRSVLSTTPTASQVLAYDGSAWIPTTNVSSQWTTSGTTINYMTGNVGIGTTAPIRPLHVYTTGAVAPAAIEDATNDAISASVRPTLMLRRTRADSTALTSGQGSGIGFFNEGFTDNSIASVARISAPWEVNQTDDTTSRDSAMTFFTALDGSVTERMRISSAGNVGIGTANPTSKLSMNVSAAYDGIRIDSTSNGFLHSYVNAGAGSNNGITQAGDKAIIYGGSTIDNAGGLVIAPWKSNTSGIRLDASGNVGIGTTSPNASLDVSGSMIVTGGIFGANTGAPDATIFGVSKATYPNWGLFYNEGAPDYIEYKSAGVVTSRIELDSGSAHFGLNGGNVGIGTSSPTRKLEVAGSIAAAGMAAESFDVSVDGTANGTWALGSLTNNGRVTHVKFYMSVHNNSTIDALTFQVSLPSYSNGTVYSNWQELPVAFGSSAWNGQKNYVIDALRSNPSVSGAPFYFRVRNKGGNGSSNTMTIRIEYNSDATFTRITHANTVATAFSSGTAAAGGSVDGLYGALEYSFPVATGQAWRPADNTGLFIKNSGYVGIGTSTPSEMLEVSGSVKAVSYLYTSDRRLKKDIVTLPDALTKVLQLRGVNFVWRNTEEKTVGFIAQEVEAVYPELVKTDKQSGYKAVQYGNIVAILVEALKQENKERVEAQNRCEAQVSQVQRAVASVDEKSQTRMDQLEKENKDLKARLEKLEKFISEKVK